MKKQSKKVDIFSHRCMACASTRERRGKENKCPVQAHNPLVRQNSVSDARHNKGWLHALTSRFSEKENYFFDFYFLTFQVNGQNVVGLEDREITGIINQCGDVVTVTIMPSFVYKHIVKHMASSLITKFMDHSIPDL